MKENLDLIDIILKEMPLKTEVHEQIQLFIQMHHHICNDFLYQRYPTETALINSTMKNLMCDLGAEVLKKLQKDNLI